MIRFLFKGILRDRSRSLFPFIVVTTGVFLTVALYCYIKGAEINVVRTNANLQHGHVKIMTRAYAKEADQIPNDLALTGVGALLRQTSTAHIPDIDWVARIQFGGLLDVPDANGETRAQAPVAGMAVDLRTPGSSRARQPRPGQDPGPRAACPQAPGEILVGEELRPTAGAAIRATRPRSSARPCTAA